MVVSTAVASFHPSLEPLDGVVGITGELVLNQVSEFAIAIAVVVIASSLDFVQWRTGNVDVALLNQRSLIAIEKVNNSVRMICLIYVSISHEADAVIAQLGCIELHP